MNVGTIFKDTQLKFVNIYSLRKINTSFLSVWLWDEKEVYHQK